MKFVTVNGINTHGEHNIDLLGARLSEGGHKVHDFDYPKMTWRDVYSRGLQFDVAQKLFDETEDGDHVVGHSFGCLVIWRCMEMGRRFGGCVLIGAAMNRDFKPPRGGANRIYAICNPMDRAVSLSRLLCAHDFGQAGTVGFDYEHISKDPEIHNRYIPHRVKGTHNHSTFFTEAEVLEEIATICVAEARAAIYTERLD